LKQQIKTREDFNRVMKEMQSFSKKGAEKAVTNESGVTVSKWELNIAKKHYKALEKEKAGLLKDYMEEQATDRGKPLPFKRGEMGTERADELKPRKPFNFDKFQSAKDWDMFNKYLNKKVMANARYDSDLAMQTNYVSGIIDIFGEENAKRLIDKINSLSPDEFVKNYMKDEQATFEFLHYDQTEQNAKLSYLNKAWGVKQEDEEGESDDEYDPDSEEY
jgi:hypothetical protein